MENKTAETYIHKGVVITKIFGNTEFPFVFNSNFRPYYHRTLEQAKRAIEVKHG